MKLRIIRSLVYISLIFAISDSNSFHIALEKAIEDHSKEAIKLISDYNFFSERYDFNKKNYDGDTIIMFAIKHNNWDIVRLLVYRNSIDLTIRNNQLETPLILAIKKGYNKIINLILDSYDKAGQEININGQDQNGNTALIHAILNNNLKIIDRLLAMQNINILLKNKAGESSINILLKTNSIESEQIINCIKEKHIDRIRDDVKIFIKDCRNWEDLIFIEKDHNLLNFLGENISGLLSDKYRLLKAKEIFKLANACNSLECLDKLIAKLYKENISLIYEPAFVSELVEIFKKNFHYQSNEDLILTSKLLKLENLSNIINSLIKKQDQTLPSSYNHKANFEKSVVLKELLQEGYYKTADLVIKNDSGKLGEESLSIAIQEKNYNVIELLLEKYKLRGKDLNLDKQDSKGNTFFIDAAIQEDQEMINLLMKYKASMWIKNNSGKTGLDILFEKRSFKSVLIISLIESLSPYPTEIATKIRTLLNQYNSLEEINNLIPNLHKYIDTFEKINLEEASYFANIFGTIVATKFHYQNNKDLIMSSYYLKLDNLFNIIRNLVKAINTVEGIPPINIRELCELLFSDNPDNSILIALINFDCIETCKLLIQDNLYLNNLDMDGNTPLIAACLSNNKDIIKLLLSKKVDAGFISSVGMTPLHAAVIGKCDEEVFKLLASNGAISTAETCMIQTPLMLAIELNNQVACKFLSQNNVQLDLVNVEQNTAIMKAIMNEKWDLVKILLQSQASVSIQNLNNQNCLNLISEKLNLCKNMNDKIKIQDLIKTIRMKICSESPRIALRKHMKASKKKH